MAGSINTDLVARVEAAPAAGETVTGSEFGIFPGGKGANQAVAAARSGAAVAMLGAVGEDDFGRKRLAELEDEGIEVGHVGRVGDRASGVALILVEGGGQNRIAYVPGATLAVRPEEAVAAVELTRPAVVLATLELPIPVLEAMYLAARGSGAAVVLNATPEPTRGRDLVAQSNVLVVNETEAVALLGSGEATQTRKGMAQALGAWGPSVVVVTLGEDGVLLLEGGRVTEIEAPTVEVVDTTGAGDAFCGVMAAWLATGATAEEATRAGVVAGALAVTKHGAQPSMPQAAGIAAWLGPDRGT